MESNHERRTIVSMNGRASDGQLVLAKKKHERRLSTDPLPDDTQLRTKPPPYANGSRR
jgi:hypothetical protein